VDAVHFMHRSHYFPEWFQYAWITHDERGELKAPVPHRFHVAKGSTHMAVTRKFVEFAVTDSRADDLLFWMRNIKVPDEHFFPTLNHNPHMGIPGAFKGLNTYVTYVLYRSSNLVPDDKDTDRE